MKRILPLIFLSLLTLPGFSQNYNYTIGPRYSLTSKEKNTAFGLYGGVGVASAHNYDVAPSAGIFYMVGMRSRSFLGADLFYQAYSLYYNNEQGGATHGSGISGAIERNKSSYVFIAPKFEYGFHYTECVKAFVNVGVGFKVGGFDSLTKWDHHYTSGSTNNYDSMLNNSKNMNSLLLRVGFGLKEYLHMGNHWWFTFTEDMGFLTGSLIKPTVAETSGGNPYTAQRLSPAYFSLQIGITHTRFQ